MMIDLTDDQREILTSRYQRWIAARRRAEDASAVLDDVCRLLAGPGYQLEPEDGGLSLYAAEEDE